MKFVKEKKHNFGFSFFSSKKAFSFVELLVGITISMLLMVSVSVFVQNGMKNLKQQKLMLDNSIKIKEFTKFLYENLDNINKNFPIKEVNSGVLFKVNKNYDKGGFAYIGEKNIDKFYCSSGSDFPETKHMLIKNFTPFEGEGGDIFNGKNFYSGSISTNMFAGLVNANHGILFGPTDMTFAGKIYISDTLGNSVYMTDTPNDKTKYIKIAGKDVFGDEFHDGENGTGIYLNNPTGLEIVDNKLLISDTLNDRILYIDLNNYKIYKLLGREDGLKEPTGLYYDLSSKTLYISNSGKKEILTYSSTGEFQNFIEINFTPNLDFQANKVVFSFFHDTPITLTIKGPTSTGNFIFPTGMQSEDFLTGSNNELSYYFADYNGGNIASYPCNSNGYFLQSFGDYPYRITNCNIVVGTGIFDKGDVFNNFNSSSDYQIKINNLTGSYLNLIGTYYIKMDFFNNGNLVYSNHFPYYVKGDNDLFTKDDNTLKVLTGGLGYPTGIYKQGANIVFNDFLERKKLIINLSGNYISSQALTDFNFTNLALNSSIDTILSFPIKNSQVMYASDNMIDVYFDYYKDFECYGELGQNLTKQFILKK